MDTNVWTPPLLHLFQTIGNERANQLWEYKLPPDERITPRATKEQREIFISEKYKDRKYFDLSPNFGMREKLGMEVRMIFIWTPL